MLLNNPNFDKLAEMLYPNRFQYTRLYFYLKFSPHKIEQIWCDDAENMSSAIIIIKPNAFQSEKNALIWADKKSSFDWLINFSESKETLHFRAISDWIYKKIKDVWQIRGHYPHDIWYLPEDVEIREPIYKIEDLRKGDIEEVDKNWGYARGKIASFVKSRIEKGETFAIYLEDKLASYAVFRENGSMGMLRTLPEFRGKGLAKSITYAMAKWVRERGYIPHLYIALDNTASQQVVSSCGFVKYERQHWFIVNNSH